MSMQTTTFDYAAGLFLYATADADSQAAVELAESLKIELTYKEPNQDCGLYLQMAEDGLSLRRDGLSLRGDLTQMIPRLKQANLSREMLVKAAKIKGLDRTPTAVDATAGMGEDALLLAAAGFSMQLFEYDPVIASLLKDSIRRAEDVPELSHIVARMQVSCTNSLEALPALSEAPDVVVLDPMFPARTKSALIKKKFQLLQQLERPCSAEEELLNAAIAARPRKIVIKRPLKGPYLADKKPDYSLSGKAIRYDCLVFARS